MKPMLSIFWGMLISVPALTRDKEKLSRQFQDTLDVAIENVESVIDPNWFIVKNDTGFTLFYCPTCQLEYTRFNSIDNFLSDTFKHEFPYPDRTDFLAKYGPDSIHFRSMVSMYRSGYDDEGADQNPYPKNDILKLDVYFQPTWSQYKIEESQKKNDELKLCINENHRKVQYISFYDYRLFIHNEYWDCNGMIRLPYSSMWYNYSIFIVLDPQNYFRNPLWPVDGTNLHAYLFRTMRILAFSLGINDFRTLEEIHQNTIEEKNNK